MAASITKRLASPGVPNCPACGQILAGDEMQTESFVRCSMCRAEIIFFSFPALIRERRAARAGEKLVNAEDASCFNHPDKVAEQACDTCGRFICGLCDMEMGDQHLCPACFQSSITGGKDVKIERRRDLKDSVALWTAILPMIVFPMVVITGPIAVYLSLRYWNAPTSVLGRTKARLIVALILGLLQTGFGAMTVIRMFNL